MLNENLISRCKPLVPSFYVEPTKEAEVGSFGSEKQIDFSVDSTTETNVQIKEQETSAEKIKLQRKKLAQSKYITAFFLLLVIGRNIMTSQVRY